jgi:hypothetical protein
MLLGALEEPSVFADKTLSEDTPCVFVTVYDKRRLCGSCMAFLAGITLDEDNFTSYEAIFEDGVELELAAFTLEDTALTLVVIPSCDAFPTDTKLVERNKE